MKKILLLILFLVYLRPMALLAQTLSVELDAVECVGDVLIPCNRCGKQMTYDDWALHDCSQDDNSDKGEESDDDGLNSHCPFCNRVLMDGETCNCKEWSCVGNRNTENTVERPRQDFDDGSVETSKIYLLWMEKTIGWLNKHAKLKSTGYCSRYVFNALDEGDGKKLPRPEKAKDAGLYLLERGFVEVPNSPKHQTGDIRVWQPYPGQPSQAGHIDMYNGKQWVSDFFEQQDMPGRRYREYPNYKTYRKK